LVAHTNGTSSADAQRIGRYTRRISMVAHSRATALGMISPKTSITGVNAAVTTHGAQPPSTGKSAYVAAEEATM